MKRSVFHMLAIMMVMTVTFFAVLLIVNETDERRYLDPPILAVISLAYASAALVLLARTRWRLMKRPSFHPLIVLVTLVTITLIALLRAGEAQTKHYFDPPMLAVISLAYFSAALMMMSRTGWRLWTVLGAGLLATILGDAVLYAYILAPRIGVELPFREERLALIRALLVIGGPFVIAGLIREEFRNFQDRRDREATKVEQAAVRTIQAATEIRHTAEDLRQSGAPVGQGERQARQDEQQVVLDETSLVLAERGRKLSNAGIELDERVIDMSAERQDLDQRQSEQDKHDKEHVGDGEGFP